MLRNYFKTAWRNLVSNKVFSLINIMGLSVSMACCLLISVYIWNELHYDTFHKNAAGIFRITEKQNQAGALYNVAVTARAARTCLTKRLSGDTTYRSLWQMERCYKKRYPYF